MKGPKMMAYCSKTCIFHPVGQGLFYSGSIDQTDHQRIHNGYWNYVYDCGTEKCNGILEESIFWYANSIKKQKLSLLILSHLHWDHVSGLNLLLALLKDRVDTVILPYYFPSERAVIYSRVKSMSGFKQSLDTAWYQEFIVDPAGFIMERSRVRQIIYMRAGDSPQAQELPEEGPQHPPPGLQRRRRNRDCCYGFSPWT